MKAVILAGGFGTRLAEVTESRPKPMVDIGGKPMLWHIMKIYSSFGITDFIICLGYKGYMIKEYFVNYYNHMSDMTVDTATGHVEVHSCCEDYWKVTLVDTGLNSMTGGRLKRVAKYLDPEEDFCMTYGDGVSSIDIGSLIEFHKSQQRLATVTAVSPPARFGALEIADGRVTNFVEKPLGEGTMINGGFFVLSPKVLDYIQGDASVWEREPLEGLARDGQLAAYRHKGFWQPMDTLRDHRVLEELWTSGRAEWKRW
jgi:glucose-1-phosphate cytidylyltransferase